MPAYLVCTISITDPEAYSAYVKVTPAIVAKFGGNSDIMHRAAIAINAATPEAPEGAGDRVFDDLFRKLTKS